MSSLIYFPQSLLQAKFLWCVCTEGAKSQKHNLFAVIIKIYIFLSIFAVVTIFIPDSILIVTIPSLPFDSSLDMQEVHQRCSAGFWTIVLQQDPQSEHLAISEHLLLNMEENKHHKCGIFSDDDDLIWRSTS